MQPMRPTDDTERRRIILIIWFGMTASALIYCFMGYWLSSSPARRSLTDRLVGPLEYLPYALPILLFWIGWNLYNAVALKSPPPTWTAVQSGMVTMLAIFEVNVIVGLLFFFIGTPLDKFLVFAAGTLILNAIALRRVMATWPGP